MRIRIENLSLRYPQSDADVLLNLQLEIAGGELILVVGPTGCGKSSLLNCINGIIQHESAAHVTGDVFIQGREVRAYTLLEICTLVGSVYQNPASQICTSTVESEVAFGLENVGLDINRIHERIDDALAVTGLSGCRHQSTQRLSGGQQQRLMIACALALRPKVLLLDEPISQLDPRGAQEIFSVLRELKENTDIAVIMVEHRTEEAISLADRVVLMETGKIVMDRKAREMISDLGPMRKLGLHLPTLPDLFDRLGRIERPLNPEEAPRLAFTPERLEQKEPDREMVCEIVDLVYARNKKMRPFFDGLSLKLYKNERIALMGSNGAGKSTLLLLLAGLLKPVSGHIAWTQAQTVCGLLMQNPDAMLFSQTVEQEVGFAPQLRKIPDIERQELVDSVLEGCGLAELADRSPFTLSRGQRLRVALASVLSMKPDILLLDEPTTGQDRKHVDKMMEDLLGRHSALLFCTHDVNTAARYANRIILMHAGAILADGPPDDVLFDCSAMKTACLRQTAVQRYGQLHNVRALSVDAMIERVCTWNC